MGRRRLVPVVLAVLAALCAPALAQAQFDFAYEARNFSKINERYANITGTPDYQAKLRAAGPQREAEALQIIAADGPQAPDGRNFLGNLCWQHMDGCAGDVRLYDWASSGAGVVTPILYTARNGGTISGHVWATKAGPAKRPGVVITSGSVQAPEELYWFAATVLAKAGYVVMTWDAQGQGYSDTFGAGDDQLDGFPSQTGRPFYDGTEDALDFFFSTPAAAYAPRKSCTSGTDHAAKQRDRVARGLNSAFNPGWAALDTSRVGLLGQSLGASAVSYVGQLDARVSAIVAMDDLRDVGAGGASNLGASITCASGASSRPATVALTKPAIGISNDYGIVPQPFTARPDPDAKLAASKALSKAGVDTGELTIRGGTHFEGAFIPNPAFTGTFRGNDLVAWYTRAWFDKHVKGDPSADALLLTDRWRLDGPSGEVDPDGDGNMFSRYFRSRLDVARTTESGRAVCEDVRGGCASLSSDGTGATPWSFLEYAYSRDRDDGPGVALGTAQGPGGSQANPVGGTAPGRTAPGCRDTLAPRSRVLGASAITRRGLALRGTSADRGCGRVARVTVSVGRAVGRRCRFLRANGGFGPLTSCLRTPYLAAGGTANWTLRLRAKLPAGLYKVFARGVDAAGNVEKKNPKSNFRKFTVR